MMQHIGAFADGNRVLEVVRRGNKESGLYGLVMVGCNDDFFIMY